MAFDAADDVERPPQQVHGGLQGAEGGVGGSVTFFIWASLCSALSGSAWNTSSPAWRMRPLRPVAPPR
jgi:hypothetical protein